MTATKVRHIKPEAAELGADSVSSTTAPPFSSPHLTHCSVHTGYNVKTPVSKSSQRGSFSPNGSTTTGPPVYPTTGPLSAAAQCGKMSPLKISHQAGGNFPPS